MKKVIKCFCMMALVALAFTSCKKEEQKSYISASTQQLVAESEDRAYMEPNLALKFEVGDICMLFNIDETTPYNSHAALYQAIQEGSSVRFVKKPGYGEIGNNMLDAYYGFYPGGEGHSHTELDGGENKCQFRVEPTQEYRVNKVSLGDMYMAAKVDNVEHLSDAHFNFHNICGILQLKPYEAAQRTVTSIEVVDNNFHLSGWVELIIPEVDMVELQTLFNHYSPTEAWMNSANAIKNRMGYNVTDAGYSILLNCAGEETPNGVQLTNNKKTTPAFNIVLRPLALSQGFHLIFTFSDGSVKDVDLSGVSSIMSKPNVVKPVNLNLDNY